MARTRMVIPIDRQNLRTKFTAFALELFWPNPGGGVELRWFMRPWQPSQQIWVVSCSWQKPKVPKQPKHIIQAFQPPKLFPSSNGKQRYDIGAMAPKLKKQPSSASRRDSKHCSITNRMAENDFAIKNKSFNFRPFHQGHRFIYVHCTCMSTIFFAATLATQRKDCIRCGPIWRRRCSFWNPQQYQWCS